MARDLGLDVNRESDLIAVAQYHLNEKRTRAQLNQAIIHALAGSAKPTANHRMLARLPITSAWTTNYDQLLENAFAQAGKIVDLKLTQENLAQSIPDKHVVLYKMHGCVTQPQDAVLTKDDYEQYAQKRQLFVESLKGDLIAKTFLFLGFSFTDPNIDYILSRVRVLIGENPREHFCIMRTPPRPTAVDKAAQDDYDYRLLATRLRQEDLLRFGIETIWVDDYSTIELLLQKLAAFNLRKSVFVSGAAQEAAPLGQDRLNGLVRDLGARLMKEGYNLISGFGLGLGEQCVVGALRALYGLPKASEAERLVVRPFPDGGGVEGREPRARHREELLARSGVVVVVAGNRAQAGGIENSPGVMEEVEIALREGKCIIPIGATGHAARTIWERAHGEPTRFLPGIDAASELQVLGDAGASNEQLLNAVFHLLAKAEQAVAI
ncbi:MAG: SIR2 family protein [Cyanobacteriota bacterium]|nr:SIR2 family protein [Cyanobacteriota bacterium]